MNTCFVCESGDAASVRIALNPSTAVDVCLGCAPHWTRTELQVLASTGDILGSNAKRALVNQCMRSHPTFTPLPTH